MFYWTFLEKISNKYAMHTRNRYIRFLCSSEAGIICREQNVRGVMDKWETTHYTLTIKKILRLGSGDYP